MQRVWIMRTKITKFLALTTAQKSCLLKIYVLLWHVRMRLWLFSYIHTRQWADECSNALNQRTLREECDADMVEIIRLLATAARYVPNATCLTQAIVGSMLLRKQGINTALHIGVKKGIAGDIEAHSWLEYNGEIILGGRLSSEFKTIYKKEAADG